MLVIELLKPADMVIYKFTEKDFILIKIIKANKFKIEAEIKSTKNIDINTDLDKIIIPATEFSKIYSLNDYEIIKQEINNLTKDKKKRKNIWMFRFISHKLIKHSNILFINNL